MLEVHVERSLRVRVPPRAPLIVGYSSGQRGQTVNLLAYAFGGSNPPPTTIPMMKPPQGGFKCLLLRQNRVTLFPIVTLFPMNDKLRSVWLSRGLTNRSYFHIGSKSTIFIAASISWLTAFKSPFRRLLPLCGRSEVKSRDPRQSSPCTIRHGEYSFVNQVLCAAKTAKIKNLCGLCVLCGEDRHIPSVFPHSRHIFLNVRDFTSECSDVKSRIPLRG